MTLLNDHLAVEANDILCRCQVIQELKDINDMIQQKILVLEQAVARRRRIARNTMILSLLWAVSIIKLLGGFCKMMYVWVWLDLSVTQSIML